MRRPAAATVSSDEGEHNSGHNWDFEFASSPNVTALPPMPRGNPNRLDYQVRKARRQAAFDDLKVLPDFRPLRRAAGVPNKNCPWRYMFALAHGDFDFGEDDMPECEFTKGSLRFYENGSLFKFVGDSVAPDPWDPTIVQYAVFQDKRRLHPQPLICVRNVIGDHVMNLEASESSSSSSSSTTTAPPPPKRRKSQSSGGSAQVDGAGPIAA